MKYFIVMQLLFLTVTSAMSQLSGSYTIGAQGEDYINLTAAIDDIQINGMSSSVELIISNGTYSDVDISSVVPTGSDSLLIRSASGNADSVIFSIPSYTREVILNSQKIWFKDISIVKQGTANNEALLLLNASYDIHFLGCRIIDNESLNYWGSEGVITLNNSNNVYFDNCYIYSLIATTIVNTGDYTIKTNGTNTHYQSDSIFGIINGPNESFRNCYLNLDCKYYELKSAIIDACDLDFIDSATHDVYATTINNCNFNGSGLVDLRFNELSNSNFDIPVYINNAAYNPIIRNTLFMQSFKCNNFAIGLKLYNNSLYENVAISSQNSSQIESVIINNFFFDTIALNGNIKLFHNNFSENSHLTSFITGTMSNNSFNNFSGSYPYYSLSNNNYASNDSVTLHRSKFDSSPTFYNPQYVSATDLHINNPALIGRATILNHTETLLDIDGESRSIYPTIGADEICINLPLADTILVACGTQYPLVNCLNIDTLNLIWKPGIVMIDSNATIPIVEVNGSTLVWLEDSLGNIIDSILFIPDSPIPGLNSSVNVGCIGNTFLTTSSSVNSSVHWSPSLFVSDSTTNTTSASYSDPDSIMQFIALVDMGVCGIKTDTIDLIPPSTPSADIHSTDSCLKVTFLMTNSCYDSLSWDFGDGNFASNSQMISHAYSTEGFYEIYLTVWLQGAVDVDYSNVSLHDCDLGIGINEISKSSVKLYPNPVNDLLNINIDIDKSFTYETYKIINITGSVVKEGAIEKEEFTINIKSLPSGIYFLRALNETIKFVKL
jgi:hypothetical protein